MKKVDPFFAFLWIYLVLTALCLIAFFLYGAKGDSAVWAFANASATISLTQTTGTGSGESAVGLALFSLLISQASGVVLLTFLLWYCRQLLGNAKEKKLSLLSALKPTLLIVTMAESFLFIFFLYGTSGSSIENHLFTSLSLAVNSVMNAGVPAQIARCYPDLISQNFVIQIGIIAGTALGGAGIYVLYELLSPKKLRERLADHTIDWSLITKISVFGTVTVTAIGSALLLLSSHQDALAGKTMVDAAINSVYEISAWRGFGFFTAEDDGLGITMIWKAGTSVIAGGPFSTGGGWTLSVFVWIFSLFRKACNKSSNMYVLSLLSRNLIIYTLITFSFLSSIRILGNNDLSAAEVILDQWLLFADLHMNIGNLSGPYITIIGSLTVIAGRLGFISACFVTLKQLKKIQSHAPDFL